MSVFTSYPGIYIQELSSSSHAIVPAPTSIAAFVGYSHPFQTMAFNVAQQCFSFNDYQTYFGPLFSSGLVDASLPRAVYQFFLNGGSVAWVVGLQPGMFGIENTIIARLGAANGGQTINATVNTNSSTTGGGTSPAGPPNFTINSANPAPTIGSILPTSTTAGNPSFTLTVKGTGFVPGSAVIWNTDALATTYIDSETLTAIVPEFEIAAKSPAATFTAAIKVTSPVPGGGPSASAETFTVNQNDLQPGGVSLPLATATVGQEFTLTVTGVNFVPASVVHWELGGHTTPLVTTYVSDLTLTAVVPASVISTAGTANVTVFTADASSQTSSPAATCTISNTYPVAIIASILPLNITTGNAAFTLTVNGANFFPDSTVKWNNVALATTFVSDTELTAIVPASAVASKVTVNITVSNPTPGGGASAPATITINTSNPAPTVKSLTPAAATVGSGPITIGVTGAGFVPSSTVLWNGAPLVTTYVSDTQVNATIPASDLAAVPLSAPTVTVTTPTGTGVQFTAMELTDVVAMNVTITNVRNSGGTFDVVITYGSRVETYRGLQLAGPAAQAPASVINPVSKLVQVAPAQGGYGTSIGSSPPPVSLALGIPANLVTCFSSSDFIEGDESNIAVFEPNSSLDNVEIFNLLLVPGVTDFSILSAALSFAERKRAFMIVDAPPQSPAFGSAIATPQPIQYWMEGLHGTGFDLPTSLNGALYFPYLVSNDPVTTGNIPMAPSGFVAGIYAKTDASRGVWKAPAGLATNVLNTAGPVQSGAMNDPQQGALNLESINCLRSFSGVGTVVWGARTLVASNAAYQQWMYVPVRRMTLFIEQTLLANLRWVVFEPNDTPLWIAITASINAFMLSLFRQGALQGTTPSDAFQVKCDSTTTTPADQAQGIVNIVVAFAPLKPAEFVIVQIAQLAGQTAGS
jgi:phage tail sheath protein FI